MPRLAGLALLGASLLAACKDDKPTLPRYKVTFDTGGGSAVAPIVVEYNKLASRPTDPVWEGYTFGGWYTQPLHYFTFSFDEPIIGDTMLYARWIDRANQDVYIVTFVLSDGAQDGAAGNTATQVVIKGDKPTRPYPFPIRADHAFSGWYRKDHPNEGFNFEEEISGNVTLYARWRPLTNASRRLARLLAFSFWTNHNVFTTLHDDERMPRGVVDEAQRSITIEPSAYLYHWDIRSLKAVFNLSAGATARVGGVTQRSGVTAHDFSSPIIYEITAADGVTKQTYTAKVEAQSRLADIPDQKFLEYLKTNAPGALVGDKLDVDAAAGIPGPFSLLNIGVTSLKGLEFFTALKELDCSGNTITTLNASQNTALTTLTCSRNLLTKLDLSHNTILKKLDCSGNQLKGLDVGKNTALTTLNCSRNYQLDVLDLSQNTALTTLDCSYSVATLDLSRNAALTTLDCSGNELKELDVSKNASLATLTSSNNALTMLDLSQNVALTTLDCSVNQLKGLDVGKNAALTTLNCFHNQLLTLDLSHNTALTTLNSQINKLQTLDLRGMRHAVNLNISSRILDTDPSETDSFVELKVHDNLKNTSQVKLLKWRRLVALHISTYSADPGATNYALTCADYDPTANHNMGDCLNNAH